MKLKRPVEEIPDGVLDTLVGALGVLDSEYGFRQSTREEVEKANKWLTKNFTTD